MSEANTSITDWLKDLIDMLTAWSCNKENENLEMTIQARDAIVDNLKRLDEYVTWLQKAYYKEIKTVSALDEYAQLLTDEMNDLVGIAHVHGWKSDRAEQGKVLREKIANLKGEAIKKMEEK
jgi:hypothetical protein